MSFTDETETIYSLPPLLDLVNARLLETPDDSPRVTPPWEKDPNWERNQTKERVERQKGELSQLISDCETNIAKLVKSSTENVPDRATRILSHFAGDSRDQVIQILSDFENIKYWFRAESMEEPAVITFTRTPAERQALARRLAKEAELKRLIGATDDPNYADFVPLEEGQYNQDQKQYWDLRFREYNRRYTRLWDEQQALLILYWKSRQRKRLRNTDTVTSPKTNARPTTRSQRAARVQVADQSQLKNASELDQMKAHNIARRKTKENHRQKHPINGASVEVPNIHGREDPPTNLPGRRNTSAKPKRGNRARKSQEKVISEPSPPRRSTRISIKPDRFCPG